MKFIKVVVEKTDSRGATIKSNQGSQFEVLIPLSKVIAIIKNSQGSPTLIIDDIRTPEGTLKIIQVKTDLTELFRRADKI